jgi:acyl phosphate:glycerol-3-phosphate acyltransferase
MPYLPYLIVAVAAYLLGSIPFGFLLVLAFRREDIRTKGSGNIGATNVVRSGGKGLGALTFVLDAVKGFIAVLAAGWIFVWLGQHGLVAGLNHENAQLIAENAQAIAALFAILGHMYPIWLRFKGGKGVATAFGVFLALSPIAALIGLAAFVIVFAISRFVSLASIVSAVVFPIAALWLAHDGMTLLLSAVTVFIPLLVIVKHHQNIVRLMKGTEYRFGKAKP